MKNKNNDKLVKRTSKMSHGPAGPLALASGWASWSPLPEGTYLNLVDSGLRGEEKQKHIKWLRSQPGWSPSDLILLDESDVPVELRDQVRFSAPKHLYGVQ